MTDAKRKKIKEGFVERISDRMPDGRYLVVIRCGPKSTLGAYTTTPPAMGATVPIERGAPVL